MISHAWYHTNVGNPATCNHDVIVWHQTQPPVVTLVFDIVGFEINLIDAFGSATYRGQQLAQRRHRGILIDRGSDYFCQ